MIRLNKTYGACDVCGKWHSSDLNELQFLNESDGYTDKAKIRLCEKHLAELKLTVDKIED